MLGRLPGIRHAFFTRAGGVSGGVYASLNAGVGSNDAPQNVAENRARMASALGVPPERFLTCYQVHSPKAVVAVEPWGADARPRAGAIVTTVAGLASQGALLPPEPAGAAFHARSRGLCGRAARRGPDRDD